VGRLGRAIDGLFDFLFSGAVDDDDSRERVLDVVVIVL
jgi:hypothetical protein